MLNDPLHPFIFYEVECKRFDMLLLYLARTSNRENLRLSDSHQDFQLLC